MKNFKSKPKCERKYEREESPRKRSIKAVFNNECNLERFYDFLVEERNQENLDFWLEVECFRMAEVSERGKIAKHIKDEYLASGTEQEVNIQQTTLTRILEKLSDESGPLLPSIFDKAQREVLLILESGPWVRFKEKKKLKSPTAKHFRPLSQYLKSVLDLDTCDHHGIKDHLKLNLMRIASS